jgi:hypothetical protein
MLFQDQVLSCRSSFSPVFYLHHYMHQHCVQPSETSVEASSVAPSASASASRPRESAAKTETRTTQDAPTVKPKITPIVFEVKQSDIIEGDKVSMCNTSMTLL